MSESAFAIVNSNAEVIDEAPKAKLSPKNKKRLTFLYDFCNFAFIAVSSLYFVYAIMMKNEKILAQKLNETHALEIAALNATHEAQILQLRENLSKLEFEVERWNDLFSGYEDINKAECAFGEETESNEVISGSNEEESKPEELDVREIFKILNLDDNEEDAMEEMMRYLMKKRSKKQAKVKNDSRMSLKEGAQGNFDEI